MAGRGPQADQSAPRQGAQGAEAARILIIDAPYYPEIAEALLAGATAELEAAGAGYERVVVPGALEIPLALAQAVSARLIPSSAANARFDGCVALGCVVRGETTHYDTVCDNANHWLMEIATRHAIPLGNAILTVETEAQALERARGGRDSKGAGAVRACLTLIEHGRAFARERP
jgi:6,7-dimethyl-8-ribityllumazine synthase